MRVWSRIRVQAAIALTIALSARAASARGDTQAEAERWWGHVRFLASATLQGRNTERPRWKPTSFFPRFASQENP